ncbi:MAG: ECF-type sigma factor [Planctomycetota bacterium]
MDPTPKADAITEWIRRLADNDPRAAEVIWAEYFEKLVAATRRKLGALPRRESDEEDIALSAIESLVRGAAAGRFPALHDRDDLLRLLLTIASRKVLMLQRNRMAAKRGGGQVRGESVFQAAGGDSDREGLIAALGKSPSPTLVAEACDALSELVKGLNDPTAEQVILLKLEGFANSEIAERLNCASRTVTRKLNLVKDKWRTLTTH